MMSITDVCELQHRVRVISAGGLMPEVCFCWEIPEWCLIRLVRGHRGM